MCGVAGVFHFDGRPADAAMLRAMNRALAHRGPDGEGVELYGACGLGHRRLSIIDLSEAGHQPMLSAGGRYAISYNGEIYNYLELRAELEGLGHQFRSRTDTEVLLEAFARWGEAAFSRFNGMWALAIFDREERRLTLCRDRFGVKPLMLAVDRQRILFASEAKALLAAEPELARADLDSVARLFLRADLAHTKSSFFQGIEFLEPGTLLTADAMGRVERRRWYGFVPAEARRIGMDRAAEEVRALLADAIKLRFRSDVPVGTCLSGGVDSSSIVALAQRSLGQAPETFSVLYRDAGFDETGFAESVIEKYGLRAHRITPDGRDVPEVIAAATYHQDGPGTGGGVYSQWHVMKLAAGRVKVLLDGQGGDEVFGGYLSHYLPYARSAWAALKAGRPQAMARLVRDRGRIESLIAVDPVRELLRPKLARVRALRPFLGTKSAAKPKLLQPELQQRLSAERWIAPAPTKEPLTDFLWDQVVRTSLPSLLHYEDRDSMAFSIESRTPFLDYRLVELGFSLPFDLKLRGVTTKAVLREAMRDLLPEPVRARTDKKGYPTPMGRWLREQHRDWVRGVLLSKKARERGIIDPSAAERLIEQHEGGTDHAAPLYQLLTLELFYQRFIDRASEQRPELGLEPSGGLRR